LAPYPTCPLLYRPLGMMPGIFYEGGSIITPPLVCHVSCAIFCHYHNMAYRRRRRFSRRRRSPRPEIKKAVLINPLVSFNGKISGSGDVLPLQPVIIQGTGDSNRVGAKIRVHSINIRGVITYNDSYINADQKSNRIGVRLLVLRPKSYSQGDAMPAAYLERLLEFTTGGFTGALNDFMCPINKEMFTAVVDKKFYMSKSAVSATNVNELRHTTKFFNIRLPGKVMTYDNVVSTQYPTNFPYIMCLGFVYLNGIGQDSDPSYAPIQMQCQSIWSYSDN